MTTVEEVPLEDGFPRVGDEVLYRADDKWCAAEVLAVYDNEELALHYVMGIEYVEQRATHGNHLYGWLSYEEAAAGAVEEVIATDL